MTRDAHAHLQDVGEYIKSVNSLWTVANPAAEWGGGGGVGGEKH